MQYHRFFFLLVSVEHLTVLQTASDFQNVSYWKLCGNDLLYFILYYDQSTDKTQGMIDK